MPARFFGQFLLERGEITREQLLDASEYQHSINTPLCALAVEEGYLSQEQLKTLDLVHLRSDERFIKIAIAGVGNCASSLLQGIEYYGRPEQRDGVGLMHRTMGGYLPESVLDLKFRLFNDDDPIEVQAEVRHVQEGIGMGVRFLNLKPEDRKRIQEFIERF